MKAHELEVQMMDISKDQLIGELNKDLEFEYAAAIQYVQHAAVMTGPEYNSIIKEMLIHANEELAHAAILSEQIAFLGGVPTVNVENVAVSTDTKTMLEQDLLAEEIAIKRYKERITQAESLAEYGLRRVLEDILLQEEEHKRDLFTVLKL
ncbi:bacterioferritin [Pseudomonadota bacterium]